MTFTVGLPHCPRFYWRLRLPTYLCSDDCGSVRAAGQIASKFIGQLPTMFFFRHLSSSSGGSSCWWAGWLSISSRMYVYREHTAGTNTTSQLPRLQLLATCLFLLVHGRVRVG
jgi:hypothetical protein